MKNLGKIRTFIFLLCVVFINDASAAVQAVPVPAPCEIYCSTVAEKPEEEEGCPYDGTFCGPGCYLGSKVGSNVTLGTCNPIDEGMYIGTKNHQTTMDAIVGAQQSDASAFRCKVPRSGIEVITDYSYIADADVKNCKQDDSDNIRTCYITKRVSEYDCPWLIECDVDEYWDGNWCTRCGDGYKDNDSTYTMVGTGNSVEIFSENKSDRCDGIEYTISLQTNTSYAANITPVASGMPTSDEYKNKEIKYKHGDGLQGVSDPTTLPDTYFQPSTSYYTFLGYFKTANDSEDTTPIIDTSGKYKIDSNPDVEIESADLRDNNTLYARYEIHNTSVWYMDKKPQSWGNAPAPKAEVVFTVKNPEADRKVKALPSNWYLDGKIFDCYECYNVKTGAACQGKSKYNPGESLIFSDDLERVLIPHYYDCPKGHYCPKGVPKDCPAGSTTNSTGQSQITSCVMKPTSSGTKFVDQYGTFYLPSNSDIPY